MDLERRGRPGIAPALADQLGDRLEVRAICDQVAHRAQQAAQEFNAAAIDGFRALAQREDVDALLMLAEQWYGSLPILAACDAGKAALLCRHIRSLSRPEALAAQKAGRGIGHRLRG